MEDGYGSIQRLRLSCALTRAEPAVGGIDEGVDVPRGMEQDGFC